MHWGNHDSNNTCFKFLNVTGELKVHPSSVRQGSMLSVHPGVLELFAVSQGVIGIKGVSSNRFLAMNKRGRLHATVSTLAHSTHVSEGGNSPSTLSDR